ncbi:MAG: hypothetical protein J3Q66DRAFT_388863 [Benniella sp.]|nr:MAG: hypothetical protein J3Q66DRAFT_388863 [Benniella sp.]
MSLFFLFLLTSFTLSISLPATPTLPSHSALFAATTYSHAHTHRDRQSNAMFQKPRLTYYRTFFQRSTRVNYNIPTTNHRHRVPIVQDKAKENAMAKIMSMIGKGSLPTAPKPQVPEAHLRAL